MARRSGMAAKRGSSCRSGRSRASKEPWPVAVLGEHVQQEPAPVGAAVEVGQRAGRLLARRSRRDARAAQGGLHLDRVPPEAVGHERGGDHGAAAGPLALVERGHDRPEQRRARGMVAHSGERARRRRVRRMPDEVHEPGARPERRRVEAAAGGLLARFAVGGHRGVDEPRIEMVQVLPADAQALAGVERRIGHEHVGALDEPAQHLPALGLAQIQGQPALGAVVDDPAVVVRALGHSRPRGAVAIGIAVGRLHLHDVGAEIGEDGRGHRPGDEARRVDDLQAGEERLGHFPAEA